MLAVDQELATGVKVTATPTWYQADVTASIDVDDGRYEFRHRLARWNG